MKKSSRTTLSMVEQEMAEPRVAQSAQQGESSRHEERGFHDMVVRAPSDRPKRLPFSLARHLRDPRKAATVSKQHFI